jgi:hypothetical protein
MHRQALIAILTVLGFLTLDVSSNPVFALGHEFLGTHDKKDIDKHCADAGGEPFSGGGIYGCWGPGGDVTCSQQTKTCYGTCEKCGQRVSYLGGISGILAWGSWFPQFAPPPRAGNVRRPINPYFVRRVRP